jgi:glucose-1-phosphate cytidylyltransferase
MKVIILCGGQGTRLREETEFRPKPLLEVGQRPVVWHIMKTFAHYNLSQFVLCLGYRGNMIKEYFLNYEAMNNDFTIALGSRNRLTFHDQHDEQEFQVTLADTGPETMTGGRIKRVRRYIDAETFLVTYGDGLADIDIRSLVQFHKSHGRLATVTAVRPASRFGMLVLGGGDRVDSFCEKPRSESWVNAGYFVFNRRVFDYLDGDTCVLEREPLERLAAEGELMAYRHEGFFYAMDTYREYKVLNELWEKGDAPWQVWRQREPEGEHDNILLAG